MLTTGCPRFLRPVVVDGGRVVWGCCGGAVGGGGGPGRGPRPAVWRIAEVLRWRWPPSPCRGSAPCGLCLVAGGGDWCCCGAATHATQSVSACNRRPPSSTSDSTSGLSRPVLPRRLWRVQLGGFSVGLIGGVEIALWEGGGLCDRLCLVLVCRGRYGFGGGFFSSFWDRVWAE